MGLVSAEPGCWPSSHAYLRTLSKPLFLSDLSSCPCGMKISISIAQS